MPMATWWIGCCGKPQMARALIVGYGNPLRGDDALGLLAADRLRALLPEVAILTCHQLAPELAATLAECDAAIFLDATAEGTPGTVAVTRLAPQSSSAASLTHHVSPQTLLELAQTLYGHTPRALLVTGAGESFAPRHEASPTVASFVPRQQEIPTVPSAEYAESLSPSAREALEKICRLVPELLRGFPALW
jgi:hydrogenase maturation protease